MQTEIHPPYKEVKFICSCGNQFTTRSTADKEEIHLDICSNCHPFFTGQQKMVDTAGRVERFQKRYAKKPAEETVATPTTSQTAEKTTPPAAKKASGTASAAAESTTKKPAAKKATAPKAPKKDKK